MGFYFPNIDPVYLFQRKGTLDDPYVPRTEEKVVYSNTSQTGIPAYYITLGEIPDYKTKVKVKDAKGTLLTEVDSVELSPTQFRVDYTAGIVYFSGINNEKLFKFEYLGTGIVNFPAERIILEDREMNLQEFSRIVKTLKTNWHPPVANFSEITASIPSPTFGDTVQTIDNGKIYRYENGNWINTQIYTDSAIADIQNKLAASLEDVDAGSFLDDDDDGVLDGGVF